MSDSTEAEVRCCACGFLCVQHSETHELVGVLPATREKWDLNDPYFKIHRNNAICLVNALPDKDRQRAATGGVASREVINESRKCKEFMILNRGLSPQGHLEMRYAQETEKRYQDRLDADRQLQEDRVQADRLFHQEAARVLADQTRTARKSQISWQVFCVLLSGLMGILGVIAGKYWETRSDTPGIKKELPPGGNPKEKLPALPPPPDAKS